MGHDVLVLVGGEGSFMKDLVARGIPCRPIRALVRPIRLHWDMRAIWEVRKALLEFRPNLVCTHSSKAGWVGRMAALSLGQPATFTAHGWAFTDGVSEGRKWLYRLAERITAPLARRIITVSEYDRRLALQYRIASPKKLITVHNGIPDVKSELRAHPDAEPVNLVMVARFDSPKDHVTLLNALASLKDDQWKLHLIGDGPRRPEVEGLIRSLDLAGRVVLWGNRHDVPQRLAESQVFLLISRTKTPPGPRGAGDTKLCSPLNACWKKLLKYIRMF
ncbi:MAG: glycosyltransferase [Firmicutes bacterium]|nr:glycosyltransferase [Bacillota bacterium]